MTFLGRPSERDKWGQQGKALADAIAREAIISIPFVSVVVVIVIVIVIVAVIAFMGSLQIVCFF